MNGAFKKNVLIVIAGPTAVGKTQMGIEIARFFDTEIISTDSRQFYKELSVGTAKPSNEEMGNVKHHFINCLSISDMFSAGEFERQALQLLDELFKRKSVVVAVGGSGLYANALCHGINEMPEIPESIRKQTISDFEVLGIEWMRDQIKKVDPAYYEEADLKNPRRLIRALEIYRTSGKPFSSFRTGKKAERKFETIWVGLELPREELNERINIRVDQMMEEGLLDEFESVRKFEGHNALKTVGYQEFFEMVDGKYTLEEAIEKIKVNTRRYAKRQMLWFQKIEGLEWFSPNEVDRLKSYLNDRIENISKEV